MGFDFGLVRLNELKKETSEKEMLRNIEFIKSCLLWVKDFFDVGKFSETDFNYFQSLFFFDTIKSIRVFNSLKKPIYSDFDLVEKLMLREARLLISLIIDSGRIDLTDFNVFQFNVQRIMIKKFSMIEAMRQRLHEKISELKKLKQAEQKKFDEQFLFEEEFNALSEVKKKQLMFGQLFEFKSGATTLIERQNALQENRKKILNQKKRFQRFESRLAMAILKSQSKTIQDISEIIAINELKLLSKTSIEKQRFVGEEERAKKTVMNKTKKLKEYIEEKGFPIKVKQAQNKILKQKSIVSSQALAEANLLRSLGKNWRQAFFIETQKARNKILQKKQELNNASKLEEKFIKARGEKEFETARNLMLGAKKHFVEDVGETGLLIDGKKHEIGGQKSMLLFEADHARKLFKEKGVFIESFISKEISHGRISLKEKASKAGKLFVSVAGKEILDHKKVFVSNIEKARIRFSVKSQEIQKTGLKEMQKGKTVLGKANVTPSKKLGTASEKTSELLASKKVLVMEEAQKRKAVMQSNIERQKVLFDYDLRFAKHRLGKASQHFKDKAMETNELFKSRQKIVVARFKAKQKAHLMKTLLKSIRTMH